MPSASGAAVSARVTVAPIPAPARFVGAAVCRECHATQFDAWSGSDHDRAMEIPTKAAVKGDFSGARLSHSGETFTFRRSSEGFVVDVKQPQRQQFTVPVRYTFGTEPLQQYLVDVGQGRLQALTVAWDTRPKGAGGQRWFHLHGDQPTAVGDFDHWQSPAYNWNSQCADCHSTAVTRGFHPDTGGYETKYEEVDVACESCHGPGSRHQTWAKARSVDGAATATNVGLERNLGRSRDRHWILSDGANIAALQAGAPPGADLATCAPCHSRRSDLGPGKGHEYDDRYRLALLDPTLYHADGQIQDEVFVLGSFLQSKMNAHGVVCTDCHEPHSLKLRAEGNALCGNCHRPSHYDSEQHHFHAAGSPGAQCVECHMPSTTYMMVDPRRDHRFGIPEPALSKKLRSPDVCTGCHKNRDHAWAQSQIEKHHAGRPPPKSLLSDALWRARNEQPGATEALYRLLSDSSTPAIVRATALQELSASPSPRLVRTLEIAAADRAPLMRRSAAATARVVPADQRWALLGRLLSDPVRSVRLEAAASLLDAPSARQDAKTLKSLESALAEYKAAHVYNSDRAESLVDLADLELHRGNPAGAQALLEQALTKDPSFSPAHTNLADLYRSRGDDVGAVKVLRAGMTRALEPGLLHHALGLALVRLGRPDEALVELRRAYELAPEVPRFGYILAVALFDTGQQTESLKLLNSLHESHPADPQVLSSLADYSRRVGKLEDSQGFLRELRQLHSEQ